LEAASIGLLRSTQAAMGAARENEMSFALYMIGFITLMGALVWAAVVAEVPQLYVGIAVGILLAIAIASALRHWRVRDPRHH
jgi:hypothetical protein